MASIKPRKRGESPGLNALDAEMRRSFSTKMRKLKLQNQEIHEEDEDSGVVYISHIPHGFYEPQMRKFFSQFGHIKRLRLSRSKKSGRSKGYAYIEFEFSEVAKVVAETMHNYLMYQKLLKCFYVPKEKLHPETFKGCFRRFKKPRRREIAADRNNRLLGSSNEHILVSQKRRVENLKKKQEKLARLGIDFKIDDVDKEWERLKEAKPEEPKPKQGVKKLTKAKGRTTAASGKKQSRKRGAKKPSQKKSAKGDSASKTGGKPTRAAEVGSEGQRVGAAKVKTADGEDGVMENMSGKKVTEKRSKSAKGTPKAAKVTPKAAKATPKAAKVTPKATKATPEATKATPKAAKAKGKSTAAEGAVTPKVSGSKLAKKVSKSAKMPSKAAKKRTKRLSV
ncbi:uncharacterized protein [Diadema setosum]|uniref:uncharacterized protein n=1 Tax=Diadema setosum TaxID=31175 RepID=UPI003B3B82D0